MQGYRFMHRVLGFIIVCLWQPGLANDSALESVSLKDLRAFAEAWEHIKSSYVEPVDDRRLLEAAIRGMVGELDTNSAWLSKSDFGLLEEQATGRYGGLGIRVAVLQDYLEVIDAPATSPAGRGGLRPGDRIIGVDQIRLSQVNIDQAAEWLRGPPGTMVDLTVEREGLAEPLHLALIRDLIRHNSVSSDWAMGGIALIRIDHFQQTTATELDDQLAELTQAGSPPQGLILDLRNNPGGMLQAAVAVSDRFLSNQLVVTAKGRGAAQSQRFMTQEGEVLANTIMLVLVNRQSASAAEIVAGALQDHGRARVMGEQTYGKGSIQSIWPLANGSGIRLTTARFYTPLGHSIQDAGIMPDIVVAANTAMDDAIMQHALRLLLDELGHSDGID